MQPVFQDFLPYILLHSKGCAAHREPEELGDAKLSEVPLDEIRREVHGAAEVR